MYVYILIKRLKENKKYFLNIFKNKDKLAAFQLLATMYVKYVQSFRRLEECYDQITHAQKRRLLRHVLDACIGRIIELKHEMIQLEFSEYHFFDDILQDLKLTPVILNLFFILEF